MNNAVGNIPISPEEHDAHMEAIHKDTIDDARATLDKLGEGKAADAERDRLKALIETHNDSLGAIYDRQETAYKQAAAAKTTDPMMSSRHRGE